MAHNAAKGLRRGKNDVFIPFLSLAVISSRNIRYHHFSKSTVGYKLVPLKLATCNKCALFLNISQLQEWQVLVERDNGTSWLIRTSGIKTLADRYEAFLLQRTLSCIITVL